MTAPTMIPAGLAGAATFPLRGPTAPKASKAPAVKAWQNHAAGHGDAAAYGINCARSGLVVIDLDTKHGQDGPAAWAAWLADLEREAPATLEQATPNGDGRARHLIYRAHPTVNVPMAGGILPGVDLRAGWTDEDGTAVSAGYIVGPGSTIVRDDGTPGTYRVTADRPVAELPKWMARGLLDLIATTSPASAPMLPPAPTAPSAPVVSAAGGDRWLTGAIDGALRDLADTAALPEGAVDQHGKSWETGALQARARRLVELSNVDPGAYPLAQARAAYVAAAPAGHEARFAHHWDDAVRHVGERPAARPEPRTASLAAEFGIGRATAPTSMADDTPAAAPAEPPSAAVPDRFAPLDWATVLDGPEPEEDWVLWPLAERGQSVSLYSAPKVGKSLLLLDMLARACAGRRVLGGQSADPVRVLYLDAENTRKDLRKRLGDMSADPAALEGLVYLSFPPLAPLDTARGAAELVELVDQHRPDLLVIDTVSRFIDGPENDADTWLNVYRLALAPLKARDVAVIRLDHTGKDAERGERGSSAKNGDVDASWQLTYDKARQTRTLTRKLTRTGNGPERLVLNVLAQPLRHEAASPLDVSADPVSHLVRKLDELGAPWGPDEGIGRDRAGQLLRDNGHDGFTKANLTAAVARRKEPEYLPTSSGQVPARTDLPTGSGQVWAGQGISAGQDLPGGHGQVVTDPPSQSCLPALPSIGGRERAGGRTDEVEVPPQARCESCKEPLPDAARADGFTTHPTCEVTR